MPDPPEVAELILRGLLPLDVGETVSGDLLEEYRESRVPAVGEFRADLWYWRQVGGMWLRAYWWLVVSAVLLHVVYDVFDTFRAPSGVSYLDGLPTLVLAVLSPLGLIGLVGLAAVYGSRRAGRLQGGFVAALGVSVIVWLCFAAWGIATFHSFAQVRLANPFWVQAWQSSILSTGVPPHASEETFRHWMYWDGVGELIITGFFLLITSFVFGGIGGLVGEIVFPPAGPRGRQIISGVLLGLGAALLVAIGLDGRRVVPPAEVALWATTGGPPLAFDAPHDGQVMAHMDLMRTGFGGGGVPPDIARIRVSEVATGATVWDVKPSPALRVCWNGCWNLTLSAGPNPASFAAGRQKFKATVPKTPTFVLTRGTAYLFEVWDSEGRVQRHGFTL
jgi:hypothetical protein